MASQGNLINLGDGGIGGFDCYRFDLAITNDTSVDIDGTGNRGCNGIGYGVINSGAAAGGGNDSSGDGRCCGIRFGNIAANIVGIDDEIALRLDGIARASSVAGAIVYIDFVDIIDSVFVFSGTNSNAAACYWIKAGCNAASICSNITDVVIACGGDRQIAGSNEIGAANGCLNVVSDAGVVESTGEGTGELAGGEGDADRYR